MYKRKGGISAPVLAILTFAVLLVVGVAILMYFYVIAPQATQQSQLSVLGEPVIHKGTDGYNLTVTLKNIGSVAVEIQGVKIVDDNGDVKEADGGYGPQNIEPGQSVTFYANWTSLSLTENHLYTVTIETNYGIFEFSAVYRGPSSST